MRRALLLTFLIALWALPAYAANTSSYPATLVDSSCTDTNDAPAAQAGGVVPPAAQTSGTADGFCDHDSRIREAAISAATRWGPFAKKPGKVGIYIFLDADDVTADAGTWDVELQFLRPHEAVYEVVGTNQFSAEGNTGYFFGPTDIYSTPIRSMTGKDSWLPDVFYIYLNLASATAWEGNIAFIQY